MFITFMALCRCAVIVKHMMRRWRWWQWWWYDDDAVQWC